MTDDTSGLSAVFSQVQTQGVKAEPIDSPTHSTSTGQQPSYTPPGPPSHPALWAHMAPSVGQPGSSASTIRPEYLNAQAHVSSADINSSPFAFDAGSVHAHAARAPAYTPTAIGPRSSSMAAMPYGGIGSMVFHPPHPHHAVHSPPIPPPRHSSLGNINTPIVPSQSPDRVPSFQVTQPTPTKRKTRASARPASVASQDTAMQGQQDRRDSDGAVSQGMSTDTSRDSVPDSELTSEELAAKKLARTREKGRLRQQRKRLRDKLAKQKAESGSSFPSRNPSAPNLLHMSSSSSSYASLPHSQSFYSLSPNNSFAFSSSTSLSGQSSPSVVYSPIIGTSQLYSPGYMTPNPDPYYAPTEDPFNSGVGGSGGISFQPRATRDKPRQSLQLRRTSQMSIGSIDTSFSSVSHSMSVSGPRTAPLPVVMEPPPLKRRKSEPEPDEFRQQVGLGVHMSGTSQSWSLLADVEDQRPSWAQDNDASSSDTTDIELGQRSPTPPPLDIVPSQPSGQTFASLILSACSDAALADKLEKQLNLGQDALGSLQSDLAGVYDRWAAKANLPSIETRGFTSGPSTANTSVSRSPVAGMPYHHIATRNGKDLAIDVNAPSKDDSPAHSAIQTPNTGQAFNFRPAGTPQRQTVTHSQTDPDMRRINEGAWLKGQEGLESPLAVNKQKARQLSHRSTQSQSTIRAPVQGQQTVTHPPPLSPTRHTYPLPMPKLQPLQGEQHTPMHYRNESPAHAPVFKHFVPTFPAPAPGTYTPDAYAMPTYPFTPISRHGRDSGMPTPQHFSPTTPVTMRNTDGSMMYHATYTAPLFQTPGPAYGDMPMNLPSQAGEQVGMLGAPLVPIANTSTFPHTSDATMSMDNAGPSANQ